MAAGDTPQTQTASVALPGLGRALVLAGKLGQKFAEEIYRKAESSRTSFIAELTGSGAVSAFDLAHTMSSAFTAPMVDLDAIDVHRLPVDLLDSKICQDYRVVFCANEPTGWSWPPPILLINKLPRKSNFLPKWGLTGSSPNTTNCSGW
jgi:hypothetical protein